MARHSLASQSEEGVDSRLTTRRTFLHHTGAAAAAFALPDLQTTSRFKTPSGHYDLNRYAGAPMEELTRYVDRCIEGAKALGQSYITWPYLDEPWRTPDIRVVAQRLNVIGAQIKQAGLQLAYHHHDFELVNHNGQIGFEIILKETDSALVKLQTDLYWMAHAGQNVHEWLRAGAVRHVARQGHAQGQPRLHGVGERVDRLFEDLARYDEAVRLLLV